jgi:hypothetical protein
MKSLFLVEEEYKSKKKTLFQLAKKKQQEKMREN